MSKPSKTRYKKENLVLLPGMMCDHRQWAPQIDALRDYCASIVVGDTTRADSIQQVAKNVLADAPDQFALAGLSMGGLFAFEMWLQAPDRITRVAILDANASAETDEKRCSREELLNRVLQGELREVFVDTLKFNYLACCNRDNQQLLDLIMDMAVELGAEVFTRQSRAVGTRRESISTLKSINVPALVLCGSEDFICPVGFHELIAEQLPNARLVVVENCGHLSTLEQPSRVNEEFVRWLTAC